MRERDDAGSLTEANPAKCMFERWQRCQLRSCAVVLTAAETSHEADCSEARLSFILMIVVTLRFGLCLSGTNTDTPALSCYQAF